MYILTISGSLVNNLQLLDVGQIATDLGVVVLIWLVQLVIYPSFMYYSRENLLRWHGRYTSAVTVVVMPLMLTQLALSGLVAYRQYCMWSVLHLSLVLCMWGITFLRAVPLHAKIDDSDEPHTAALQLVKVNWWRTLGWSTVFLITILRIATAL